MSVVRSTSAIATPPPSTSPTTRTVRTRASFTSPRPAKCSTGLRTPRSGRGRSGGLWPQRERRDLRLVAQPDPAPVVAVEAAEVKPAVGVRQATGPRVPDDADQLLQRAKGRRWRMIAAQQAALDSLL